MENKLNSKCLMEEKKLNSKMDFLDPVSRQQLRDMEIDQAIESLQKAVKASTEVNIEANKQVMAQINGLSSRIYAIEQNLLPAQEAPKEESKGKLSDFLKKLGL